MIGDEKTALFVIISDTDDTFNFIVSIMYTQLFNLLCDRADDVYHGRLPVHVRCLLDEFANIGQIPKFEKLIATIRSREISASIILQSKSQLKAIYKDNADTIEGNCDTTLFLGGKEKTTLKEMAEIWGKETIDLYNTSDTMERRFAYDRHAQEKHRRYCPPPGLRDRGTPGEHRPCGFRLLQTGHHRRRQNDESAGSGKRSRTQAAFYRLSHDIEMRSCRGA